MKRILFKSDEQWYYSQYPEKRNLKLETPPVLTPKLDEWVEKGFAIFENNGEYHKPVSHRLWVYKRNETLVFDDPILGIYGEPFVPSVRTSLNLSEELETSGFWVEIRNASYITHLNNWDYVFEFSQHKTQSEEGVEYKNWNTGDSVWFCSCFRCYFNFLTPPKYVGVRVLGK